MKITITFLMTLMLSVCACTKTSSGTATDIYIRQTSFELLAGEEFVLNGTINDPSGVKSITASCPALDIHKEILVEQLSETYPFLISLQIPEKASNGTEKLLLEIVNGAGKTFKKEVILKIIAKEAIDFHMGADISWITEMENKNQNFKDVDGNPKGCMELMKDYGLNALRFRVWVDPSKYDNWCNLADLLIKCKRAKQMGFDIMIDFHYSDWWADPGKQTIPAAWKGHSYEQVKEDVKAHTTEVLQTLKDNDIEPLWVQIGNETNSGMIWPVGKIQEHPDQYAGLFIAGHQAAKAVFPNIKVIVHLSSGHDSGLYNWNLGILKKNEADWDIIGMSVYPFWADAKTPEAADKVIDDSVKNMQALCQKYQCDMMVVETGMLCADNGAVANHATLSESKRQLARLLDKSRNTPGTRCKGVFYWEPECRPDKYALGAFDAFGKPTIIMDAFKEAQVR